MTNLKATIRDVEAPFPPKTDAGQTALLKLSAAQAGRVLSGKSEIGSTLQRRFKLLAYRDK